MRRFELIEGSSKKFWEVEVDGPRLRVRFGRLGTAGQTKDKTLGSAALAQKEADKLIAEKTKKGYAEVSSAAGAPATAVESGKRPGEASTSREAARSAARPGDELALLRASFAELEESTYGELSFTKEPSIVDTFMTDEDAERWQAALSGMEWIAEEADGGAVGYWTHGGETVVVYLDDEGSFHATGRRLVDHLSFAADGADASLRKFCKDNRLDPPMTAAQRKALAKKVVLPDALFATLAREAARPQASRKASASKGAKAGGKVSKADRGPRPFSRTLAGCTLADGRLLIVTGEDFGKSYGQIITRGAVFIFDPATTRFEARPAASVLQEDGGTAAFLFPTADGAIVLARPYSGTMVAFRWAESTNAWSDPHATPVRADLGTVAHRLPDGQILLFGGERAAVAVGHGTEWESLPPVPEARSHDQVVPFGDKLWILGGEARGDAYFGSTDRTWLLDLEGKRWSDGPSLPKPMSRVLAFPRADGSVVLLDDSKAWIYADGQFGVRRELPELAGTGEVHVRTDEDTLVSARWKDGAVIRTSLCRLEAKQVGRLALGQSNATPLWLGDGRVLFVGGTLFANREAEPEIFSLADGTSSPLPGWESDVARQAKALEKDRAKRR